MVQDLCIIMLTAGVTSLLFKLLKQPVVLGYIVAGMLVGPYVLGKSWVSDAESVDTWGQIGVLFLLFALGLEFSFKKLLQLGSSALIAAGVIVVGMMTFGFLTGRLLGWDELNSLFLGGMLCMSSTTIVFKALDDLGLRNHQFADNCFGILVVEDLFAVVLIVMLTSIATTRSFAGTQMLLQVTKLIVYLVLWFVIGITLLPLFLKKFKRYLNDETLTILSVGLCLGMVLLAVGTGFSSALGAFVMGSLLAETLEAERIEQLVQPIKNVFGSIFFVSVGMMINPVQLAEYWLPILIITFVVTLGQIVFSTFGSLLAGQTLQVSLQTGFSLAQIGEFAFIIAGLGQTLGVTDVTLYPIIVAVSVVTTFLTPYIIRLANPAYNFIDSHMSPALRLMMTRYAQKRSTVTTSSAWHSLLRKVLISLFIYGILITFVDLLFFNYVQPFLQEKLSPYLSSLLLNILLLLLVLTLTSPLLYAMATAHRKSPETTELWHSGRFQKAQSLGIVMLRILVATFFVAYAISRVFSLTWTVVILIAVLIVAILLMSRRVRLQSHLITRQFNDNLSAREKTAEQRRTVSRQFTQSLLNYEVHIADFTLDPLSRFCGKSLRQLNIRPSTGVSIVRIVRAGIHINIPGGNVVLYPGDHLIVAGDDTQIDRFGLLLRQSIRQPDDQPASRPHVTLQRFTLTEEHPLVGRTIATSQLREQAQCIVIAIERGQQLITNPDPQYQFQPDDTLVLAGETQRIQQLLNQKPLPNPLRESSN